MATGPSSGMRIIGRTLHALDGDVVGLYGAGKQPEGNDHAVVDGHQVDNLTRGEVLAVTERKHGPRTIWDGSRAVSSQVQTNPVWSSLAKPKSVSAETRTRPSETAPGLRKRRKGCPAIR